MRKKITLAEPEGPLRQGLLNTGIAIGPEYGGHMFQLGRNLANDGLHVVLDLQNLHRIGDSDHSIPQTYQTVRVGRERGFYSDQAQDTSNIPDALIARL